MTAQIIPFPEQPRRYEEVTRFVYLTMSGIQITDNNDCTEYMHFFDSKSLPCHCGQEAWPERKP